MKYGEPRAREICRRVHGNESLWALYLEDACEELMREPRGTPPTPSTRPAGETVMPFGEHRGKKLANVPEYYLAWLRENTDISGDLLTAVELELEER